MTGELPLEDLLGVRADESLLSADARPPDVGSPPQTPERKADSWLVGLGATLTGVTLIGGLGLVALGIAELLSAGSSTFGAIALASGILLAATHWGWVHVAEASAQGLRARRDRPLQARRELWLSSIEPFPRYDVSTRVAEDGSIEIVRVCYRPIRVAGDRFTFERIVQLRELHDASEPAATVAERAELLRREAALQTERAHVRLESLRGDTDARSLAASFERERLAATRAASEALSERINANLREPPLRG